jgi:hypothetical protein
VTADPLARGQRLAARGASGCHHANPGSGSCDDTR